MGATLTPRGSYTDQWVNWAPARAATHFGRHGLATGELDLTTAPGDKLRISVEFVPSKPANTHFQTLIQINSEDNLQSLTLGQWEQTFILLSGDDYANSKSEARTYIQTVFTQHEAIKLDIVISATKSTASLNGKIVSELAEPTLDVPQGPSRIAVGNNPSGTSGWTGSISRLRIEHVGADGETTNTAADYRFDVNQAPLVVNDSSGSEPLHIPDPGHYPEKRSITFEPLEALWSGSRLDIFLNFLGFIPLGFVIYLATIENKPNATHRRFRYCILVTLTGFAASVAIESMQIYIPGRNPHAHDIVLNTLGTLAGAVAYALVVAPKHLRLETYSTNSQ